MTITEAMEIIREDKDCEYWGTGREEALKLAIEGLMEITRLRFSIQNIVRRCLTGETTEE